MALPRKAKSTRKGRKIHRHVTRSPAAATYRAEKRWEKNKAKKLVRHLKLHPGDKQSVLKPVVDYKVVKIAHPIYKYGRK